MKAGYGVAMNLRSLRLVLRAIGAGWALSFVLVLVNAWLNVVTDDGWFGSRFVWDSRQVAAMLASVNIVMGLFLYATARDPRRHGFFIDFFLVANIAHMTSMLVMAIGDEHHHVNLTGDVPLAFVALGILAAAWLPHRRSAPVLHDVTSPRSSTPAPEPR